MRRQIVGMLLLMLLVGSLVPATADAAKRKKSARRVAKLPYTEPAYGTAGFGLCFQGSSCVMFPVLTGEKYVSIEIKDDLGTPVYASIIQDTSGDGSWLAHDDYTVHICGETPEPIEIEPGLDVTVWVWQGPGLMPPCPGVASAGTVKATFTK